MRPYFSVSPASLSQLAVSNATRKSDPLNTPHPHPTHTSTPIPIRQFCPLTVDLSEIAAFSLSGRLGRDWAEKEKQRNLQKGACGRVQAVAVMHRNSFTWR